jgi:membrane protein implicated in regulation of membrane protease activity
MSESLLRALDLSVVGITIHHSFYRKDAKEAASMIRAQKESIDALTAALQQISDMGPMSVDDQRWRIARDTLDALKQKGPASA